MITHLGCVGQQTFFFHDANGLYPGSHGQRVATKGAAVVSWRENLGRFRPRHHRAHRYARAQAFGQRHHVGLDARPLVRKPLAGSAHAALDLINHQQPVAFVAQRTHVAQVVHVHRVDSAFALDGLKEHRHHVGVVGGGSLQRLNVVDRDADEAFHQRTKTGLHLGVAGGAQGGDGATVKGFFVNHDLRALNALVVAKFAGQFQSGFVGLQAGGAEEHIGHAGAFDQQARQLFL